MCHVGLVLSCSLLVPTQALEGCVLSTSTVAKWFRAWPRCLQASILREQAVLALVKVLDGGPVSAGTAASVWALMEICMRNPAGQQELLQHEGLAKVHSCPAQCASHAAAGPRSKGWLHLMRCMENAPIAHNLVGR